MFFSTDDHADSYISVLMFRDSKNVFRLVGSSVKKTLKFFDLQPLLCLWGETSKDGAKRPYRWGETTKDGAKRPDTEVHILGKK